MKLYQGKVLLLTP